MTLQSKWKMTWKLELCRVFAVSNNQGPALGVPILRIMIMQCLWKPRLPHTPFASFVTLSTLQPLHTSIKFCGWHRAMS